MELKMRSIILFCLISLLTACAIGSNSGSRQAIKHPGKYELIYFGYEVDHPGQYKALANKKAFFVEKDTVVPSVQSIFLLENTEIKEGDLVLDIGTGSGIQAIFAAEKAKKVIATDINPNAIESTNYNVKYHGVQDKIETRLGDLLQPIKNDEIFDAVIFNIDYPYDDTGKQLWEVHERFFANIGKHLKDDGTIFYQSGWIWNIPKVMEMIRSNGFEVVKMNMVAAKAHNREPIVFTIKHGLKSIHARKTQPKMQTK